MTGGPLIGRQRVRFAQTTASLCCGLNFSAARSIFQRWEGASGHMLGFTETAGTFISDLAQKGEWKLTHLLTVCLLPRKKKREREKRKKMKMKEKNGRENQGGRDTENRTHGNRDFPLGCSDSMPTQLRWKSVHFDCWNLRRKLKMNSGESLKWDHVKRSLNHW